MDYFIKEVEKYLHQTVTIYLHSTPNFILETFLTIVVFIIYIYQHIEVSRIARKILRLKPHTILCRANTAGGSNSRESISTTVTRFQRKIYTVNPSTTIAYKRIPAKDSSNSQMGWVLPNQPQVTDIGTCTQGPEKKRYADQLMSLTPEQFVKIDKERKLREKELDSYMASLSTLCKNVIKKKYSERTLNRQVELVREGLECNKMSLEGKYLGFKTDAMTESLFCLLEHLITNTSLKNPLPFKGDITALALDAAELSQNKPIRDIEKWEGNSSGCISDVTTEDTEIIKSFKECDWHKDESIKVDCLVEKF